MPTTLRTVHFYCVLCGVPMNADAELAGKVAECTRCNRMSPVPPPQEQASMTWADIYPPDILTVEMKFACTECDNRLIVDIRMSGTPVYCPVCAAITRVPHVAGLIVSPAEAAMISKNSVLQPINNLSAEEIDFLQGPIATAVPAEKSPDAHAVQR